MNANYQSFFMNFPDAYKLHIPLKKEGFAGDISTNPSSARSERKRMGVRSG
jgi:hypothetical protein